MKKDIRQQKILDYLSHFERISISEICEIFDIVPMTARRDLKELENDHKLIRTHGFQPCIILGQPQQLVCQSFTCHNPTGLMPPNGRGSSNIHQRSGCRTGCPVPF